MAITVISYAPVGHSYFHTPPATGAFDTNLTVTGAYDHFAGSVICANIYIIALFYVFRFLGLKALVFEIISILGYSNQ